MQQRLYALSAGFLLLQIAVGYEWFASGLTKLVQADFPAGLAADLHERAKVAAPWYGLSPVASDSFDEGVSLDALLVGIQLVFLGVALASLAPLRAREARANRGAGALYEVGSPTGQATPVPPRPQ